MRRKPRVTKENQGGNGDDALLKDQSVPKNGTTRRSRRLNNATSSQDIGMENELDHADVLLGTEGMDNKAEQSCTRSPDVEEKEIKEIKRPSKLAEEKQAAGKSFPSQESSAAEIKLEAKANKYKSMYVDAQKKIRVLQREKNDLIIKLECVNAKLEGYLNGQQIFCGLIHSLKDAYTFTTPAKTTATSLERPSTGDASATPKRSTQTKPRAAKRKKVTWA